MAAARLQLLAVTTVVTVLTCVASCRGGVHRSGRLHTRDAYQQRCLTECGYGVLKFNHSLCEVVGHLNVSCLNSSTSSWHRKFLGENITLHVVNSSTVAGPEHQASNCGVLPGAYISVSSSGKAPLEEEGWILDVTLRYKPHASLQSFVIAEVGTSENGAVIWLQKEPQSSFKLFLTKFMNNERFEEFPMYMSLHISDELHGWTQLTLVAQQNAVVFVNGEKKGVMVGHWNLSLPLTSIGDSWSSLGDSVPDFEYFQTFSIPGSLWSLYKDCEHLNADLSCAINDQVDDSIKQLPTFPRTLPTYVSGDYRSSRQPSGLKVEPTKQTVSHMPNGIGSASQPTTSPRGTVREEDAGSTGLFIGVGIGVGVVAVCLFLLVLGLFLYCFGGCHKDKKSFIPAAVSAPGHFEYYAEWLHGPTYAEPSLNHSSRGPTGYLQPVPSVRPSNALHSPTSGGSEYDYAYSTIRRGGSTGSISHITGDRNSEPVDSVGVETLYATVTKYQKHNAISMPADGSAPVNDEINSDNDEEFLEHESAYSSDAESSPTHAHNNIYWTLEPGGECYRVDIQEELYWSPAKTEKELFSQLGNNNIHEINMTDIDIQENVGSGQFGTVERALWFSVDGRVLTVAVKTLKSSEESDRVRFFQEAAIVGQFHHCNIIALCGVVFPVSAAESPMIVMEYMPNGNLKEYLLELRSRGPGEETFIELPRRFLMMMRDVAAGMAYLMKKAYIHRDLAARNVMLDHTFTCKITDFGLSRDLADDYYVVKHGGKIPVRWTAPEAVKNRRYSSSSDVWSYGILVYEIWSVGERPYGCWGNQMVITHLTDGYRLPPPAHCPRPVYSLMIDCWHPDHHSRPGFAAILDRLSVGDTSLLMNPACEPLLGNFGDDLEVGCAAYKDLQTLYCQM